MIYPIIDGVDFSPYINKRRYKISYEARVGSNGGTMLDGSETVDILAWKSVCSFELNALTSEQMSTVTAKLMRPYVTMTYFDTRTNSRRTAEFIPSIDAQNYAFERSGKHYFYEGTAITLRER